MEVFNLILKTRLSSQKKHAWPRSSARYNHPARDYPPIRFLDRLHLAVQGGKR